MAENRRPFVLSIDQGTTGTTVLAVDTRGDVAGRGYKEITQQYPQPGWVEHDPEEIWRSVLAASAQAMRAAGALPADILAVGVANQRETLVLWDRNTLRPLCPAIVWQDRRTADDCARLKAAGLESRVKELTGLVVDPYFTGTKLAWARRSFGAMLGAAAGTVDSWLVARMSGGRDHVTDASNASRTLLFDIRNGAWSEELADMLEVDLGLLPEVRPSSGPISMVDPAEMDGISAPITGVAGDQQAALFGQLCLRRGMAKNTYGTGSFVLLQTGSARVVSETGMLTTVAWQRGGRMDYALEGAIFVTGAALQWLRDGLGIIARAEDAGPLAASVAGTGDVYFVPALAGLGAPHWDPYARGTIIGITGATSRAQVVRAAVEAMAHQTRDVVEAMAQDAAQALQELRVDGGASAMDVLCQFQADLLGIPVRRPRQTETTALGAAFLAGLGAGIWAGEEELAGIWQLDREFEPSMSRDEADLRQGRWRQAVERSANWAGGDNL